MDKLSPAIPNWTYEPKIFVSIHKGHELIGEETGWILYNPNFSLLVKIEREARRLLIMDGNNQASLNNLKWVSSKVTNSSSQLGFETQSARTYLVIPHQDQPITISSSFGSLKHPTAKTSWELNPRINSETTLGELFRLFHM